MPRLPAVETLARIPPLAILVFRATAPVAVPRKATTMMPEKEWEANRRIEAARPGAHAASIRALARWFRHREIPVYQVTARAAMVEGVLRGPWRDTDPGLVGRLLEYPAKPRAWVELLPYLELLRLLRVEGHPKAVLAAAREAVVGAEKSGDPLGMLHGVREVAAMLQEDIAILHWASVDEARAAAAPSAKGGTDGGDPKDPLRTIPEAAKRLTLGVRTVWRAISVGQYRVVRLSKRVVRMKESEIQRILRNREP